jgi:amino acid adenylation domain-containing protein
MKVHSAKEGDCYPLSPMQQGMLYHRLAGHDRGVDVEQVICELAEEIEPAQFARAWNEVIARHAILRTSFRWDGDEPRQIVHAPSEVRLALRSEEFGSEREARRGLEEYLACDRAQGFDLASAPLLRVALLRGAADRSWFVVTFHHLLLDGRAMITVFREVLDLHDAFVAGRRLELPEPRPYRSYIDWLQTVDTAAAEEFWRERLKGCTDAAPLPSIRPASVEADAARGELALQLREADTARLRAVAREHKVTLNTLVQAAWAVVLSRHAGVEHVVFGAVRACRHIPVDGAESLVGLLINTVPLSVRVDADALVASWLQTLRTQWLDLRGHEHTPLVQIQQWSGAPATRPLFETVVNYQEPSWDAALCALGGSWTRRAFDIRSQSSYPLALDVAGGPRLTVKLLYAPSRIADAMAARTLGHFRTVLEALGEGTSTVGELPLLTAFERRQMLQGWNATATRYDRHTCVHALVERQAALWPARLAVADEHTTLSYAELNARANRLARRLRVLGVERDRLVAVCLPSSCRLVVAQLAVWKAGGAFVALDPAAPPARIEFQLSDCAARVLIVPRGFKPAAEFPRGLVVLETAEDGGIAGKEFGDNLATLAGPADRAYVIYTSGSTGQPKGVEIEHRSLANLVHWHGATYAVTCKDRASQLANPAFDASVWEIWPYLANGASVHIPPEDVRIEPASLVRWLAEHSITLAFLPTPLAEAVFDETWPRDTALRAILTGGDKLKRRPPRGFPCALVNHYGPTEATVVATCGHVAAGEAIEAPTIGGPMANTQVFVVDARGRLLPAGVPGELLIGGDGLARGYLNRPELTAERFITARFGDEEPRRLYRTGDLVRWRLDGELEFVGRLDNQVKIRGHRIEPGEIEAALQRHADVREALVIARVTAGQDAQLIAYVLPRGPGIETADITAFLRARLPAFLVPAAIVVLECWPLTANGKIDRAALPAPNSGNDASPDSDDAPRGRTEEIVATNFCSVLGRASVGRNASFFDLGGHSLLAAQLTTRLNAAFAAALTVRDLFDRPTVAELAARLERLRDGAPATAMVPLRLRRRTARADLELASPS